MEPAVSTDGSVCSAGQRLPFSPLASNESKKNFYSLASFFSSGALGRDADIRSIRKHLDDELMRPGVDYLRQTFPVDIRAERIGGVPADVIIPRSGVSKRNTGRVLLNLHGGGFTVGAGLGGQMESIPIAAIGAIQVISVQYRQGPEYKYPAATDDIEAVYRELLRQDFASRNIGIYGCSAGAILTAQVIARFAERGLPMPGAIGMFGAGALVPLTGDSRFIAGILNGRRPVTTGASGLPEYFQSSNVDPRDPLISPAYTPATIARFPPTLIISGTRDIGLSSAVYTHAQLVRQRVETRLHIWEGATHCSFAQPIADPHVPETREAWDVIVQFFDEFLGKSSADPSLLQQ